MIYTEISLGGFPSKGIFFYNFLFVTIFYFLYSHIHWLILFYIFQILSFLINSSLHTDHKYISNYLPKVLKWIFWFFIIFPLKVLLHCAFIRSLIFLEAYTNTMFLLINSCYLSCYVLMLSLVAFCSFYLPLIFSS